MAEQLLAKRKRKRRWCVATWLACCVVAFVLWRLGWPYSPFFVGGIWALMEAAYVTGQINEAGRLGRDG